MFPVQRERKCPRKTHPDLTQARRSRASGVFVDSVPMHNCRLWVGGGNDGRTFVAAPVLILTEARIDWAPPPVCPTTAGV
jgi:hypothetical protein